MCGCEWGGAARAKHHRNSFALFAAPSRALVSPSNLLPAPSEARILTRPTKSSSDVSSSAPLDQRCFSSGAVLLAQQAQGVHEVMIRVRPCVASRLERWKVVSRRSGAPCSCAGARPEILSRPFSSEADIQNIYEVRWTCACIFS